MRVIAVPFFPFFFFSLVFIGLFERQTYPISIPTMTQENALSS